MKVMIENKGALAGLADSDAADSHHTTLLDEFRFERRTCRFQNIRYWDVWDAGDDEFCGNGPDGYRTASGSGLTLEGHGEGLRLLVNENMHSSQVVKYLKGLIVVLEARQRISDSKVDDVF